MIKVLKITEGTKLNEVWRITPDNWRELNNYTIPQKLYLDNFKDIYSQLLYKLPQLYNCGCEIIINNKFTFLNEDPKNPWYYSAVSLTPNTAPKAWTKRHPNWLDYEESRLLSTVEKFNEYQKNRVYKHNSSWELREQFYKQVYSLRESGFKVYSPSEKTYWEYTNEQSYNKTMEGFGSAPELTPQELNELQTEGLYYGVEIPQLYKFTNTRKTKNGYTEEPYLSVYPTAYDFTKHQYNSMTNAENIPKYIRQEMKPQQITNSKLMRDAYNTLQYLKQFGDEFLIEGYHRCPKCNAIYHENKGCVAYNVNGEEIIHVPQITIYNADKLLYGIYKDTFEDLDVQKEYFRNK